MQAIALYFPARCLMSFIPDNAVKLSRALLESSHIPFCSLYQPPQATSLMRAWVCMYNCDRSDVAGE